MRALLPKQGGLKGEGKIAAKRLSKKGKKEKEAELGHKTFFVGSNP